MEFTAIDVETANSDVSSICQIGAVRVIDFEIVEEWKTLINPQEEFSKINSGIHGIKSKHVSNAPVFSEVFIELNRFIGGSICIAHGAFDQSSVS